MREIPLSQGKVALVDDEDYERVSGKKWYAIRKSGDVTWYAKRNEKVDGKARNVRLHRFIMRCPDGMSVDHIDGDGLNNCKSNLRIVTHAQNMKNQRKSKKKGKHSAYKGIERSGSKWRVSMTVDMVRLRPRGSYETDEQAARAYDALAREHFGEFARLNFPS